MKIKIFIFIFAFIFGASATLHCSLFIVHCSSNFACEAAEPQYARIKNDGIYMHSSPAANAIMFEIPKSYFVELLENATETFFKAKYMDVTGYVKKTEVTCINGIPEKPYASSISFRIFATSGLNLRSTPEASSPFNVLDTIPFLSTDQIFYGNINGEESISQKGGLWYYCKYVGSSTPQFGYVYSVFCDSLPAILQNTETFEEISEPNFGSSSGNPISNPVSNLFELPIEAQIAIITGVALFSAALLFLIIRPAKMVVKTQTAPEQLPKPKRAAKHADYYEFDEDDL